MRHRRVWSTLVCLVLLGAAVSAGVLEGARSAGGEKGLINARASSSAALPSGSAASRRSAPISPRTADRFTAAAIVSATPKAGVLTRSSASFDGSLRSLPVVPQLSKQERPEHEQPPPDPHPHEVAPASASRLPARIKAASAAPAPDISFDGL